jgi:dTDP-4-dehydrorhamnose reductase
VSVPAVKILLTDGSSGLGALLTKALEAESFDLYVVGESELAWDEPEIFLDLLKTYQPDFVINNAGWASAPTEAEQQILLAAAKTVASGCALTNIIPIHLSSYRVFGADHKASYAEFDSPVPVTDAGRAYQQAEEYFSDAIEHWLCLRMAWVLGSWPGNTLTNLLGALVGGETLTVNQAYPGAPTTDHDIARILVSVIRQVSCGAQNWGVFHYCSGDDCSQAEFATAVASILEQDGVLNGQVDIVDREPGEGEAGSAVLSCRRIGDNFGVQARSWRQGLHTMIKLWLRENGYN